MKTLKRITAILGSLILLAGTFSIAQAEENVISPESLTVIGDSISSGYGLDGYISGDNYSAENYGKLLCDEYAIKKENYYNYAIDGETTTGLLAKLQTGQYDEGIKNSQIIVVSIGGNDLLNVIIGEDSVIFKDTELEAFLNGEINIAQLLKDINLKELTTQLSEDSEEQLQLFYKNMPQIAKYITDKNPDALVILQTLYNPMNSGIEAIDNLYGQTVSSLNFGIDGMEGCVIADVYTAFKESDKELIQKDYTHPNDEGHKLIFNTIKQVIEENYVPPVVPEEPDEPVITQPVETTTTTSDVTTTITQVTTDTPATTTVVNTDLNVTTTIDDDNDYNNKISTIAVPVVLVAIGLIAFFGILSISKNRKN